MTTLVLDNPEKVQAYKAIQLKHALRLYERAGIIVTRGATPTRLLRAASAITGQPYKNSSIGRRTCITDLETFIESKMSASNPGEVHMISRDAMRVTI